jgi:hypothetical protein
MNRHDALHGAFLFHAVARLSFSTACELGVRGGLDEWERLMGGGERFRAFQSLCAHGL